MDNTGMVICLLKHMTGSVGASDVQSADSRSICLGYFGRADVVSVSSFREYMQIASENNASFLGTRKQLLLYMYPGYEKEVALVRDPANNELPFRPAENNLSPAFCCLSILNLSSLAKKHMQKGNQEKILSCLWEQLHHGLPSDGKSFLKCALAGSLGMEDLCVILLSDHFPTISRAIDRLRNLQDCSGNVIVDNSHSTLMMSGKDNLQGKWGTASAEIHFSLRTSSAFSYLEQIRKEIISHVDEKSVELVSRMGEHDALIRCPAAALGSYLYGSTGLLSYENEQYQKAFYQSETILCESVDKDFHPIVKMDWDLTEEDSSSDRMDHCSLRRMTSWIDERRKCIEKCLLGQDDNAGNMASSYVGMVLYRLLKDYMHIASIPFGEMLQKDLLIQLKTAVEALVLAAKEFQASKKDGRSAQKFDQQFSNIVEAVSNSMRAASQVDRLCFEEQHSNLDNIGAYHKVLLAYYGIVKDVLTLIYSIPRRKGCEQAVLIPLLSFGHTPVVCSCSYEAEYNEKPAKLICITMPYQALTNIPKYIGMLVHELFHYSAPSDRARKNETAGICLTAAAFVLFLEMLGKIVYPDGTVSRDRIFTTWTGPVLESAKVMFLTIQKNQEKQYADFLHLENADDQSLPSGIFFQTIREALIPSIDTSLSRGVKQLYCQTWLLMRDKIAALYPIESQLRALFLLDEKSTKEDASAWIEWAYDTLLPRSGKQISAYLSVYEKTLCELAPDLFDIYFVLDGESKDEQGKQYLWQIHSIRSDKFVTPERQSSQFDGNDIRIGILLDHFVFEPFDAQSCGKFSFIQRQKTIEEKLAQWFSQKGVDDVRQKDERNRVETEARISYELYQSESLFANTMLHDYFGPIIMQLDELRNNAHTKAIICKLSNFYGRYCKILDKESGVTREGTLFRLSIEIMETFQVQCSLETLFSLWKQRKEWKRELPTQSSPPDGFGYDTDDMPQFKAFHPQDLSKQVMNAYHCLCPKGGSIEIWSRGETAVNRKLLPTIMRNSATYSKDGFISGLRKVMTLAKSKILPRGEHFHPSEWLALLQHHEFSTNLLDWSENFTISLYFATKKWQEHKPGASIRDAAIYMLNPLLMNLAAEMLESKQKSEPGLPPFKSVFEKLCAYLADGKDGSLSYPIPLFANGEEYLDYEGKPRYSRYFDLNYSGNEQCYVPVAAVTPRSTDRIKAQTGTFIFFPLSAKPKEVGKNVFNYNYADLRQLHSRYFEVMKEEQEKNSKVPSPIPFLCEIILSSSHYNEFVEFVRAIGLRKFQVYPELGNLVPDIQAQAYGAYRRTIETQGSEIQQ